jgi:lysozyme
MVDGKPVVQGEADAGEMRSGKRHRTHKALAWVDRNIKVPLTEPQKAGIASFCRTISARVNVSHRRSISA